MLRSGFRALIAVLAVASTLVVMAAPADARIGGGFSSGSRGSRSFAPPPSTSTAPSASSLQRTTAPPSAQPGIGQPRGGMFGGRGLFGGGLFGGLAAGFLGAGLFGLLFGHGMFGGLGGIFSFLGLIFQIGLIALIAMFVWRYFQRRNQIPRTVTRPAAPALVPVWAPVWAWASAAAAPRQARHNAATPSASPAPTTMPSSARSGTSRPPTATRISVRYAPERPLKCCPISPRISRRTGAGASSTGFPM
jgi:predicted lipid-binding transport protein (Tim44 family)